MNKLHKEIVSLNSSCSLERKVKFSCGLALAFMIFLAGIEIFARYQLGLGDPPIYIVHPSIEYLYKPDQDVIRFGKRILINQYGMRSNPFSKLSQKDELRVMIFGDSVLNGGSQTDHKNLATTILEKQLSSTINKKIVVGNISAGSWGPGNWLAYAKEYGFFGADIVAVIISSHDYADNPSFSPLNKKTHPTEKPVLALLEGIERYLPRYLPFMGEVKVETEIFLEPKEMEIQKGLSDMREFLKLAKKQCKKVIVFQHLEISELNSCRPRSGYYRIKETCNSINVCTVSLASYLRHPDNSRISPYRDNIHLNDFGQQLMASAFIEHLKVK